MPSVCKIAVAAALSLLGLPAIAGPPGSWPEPRQNRHLTAMQPLAGAMATAPTLRARYDLGRSVAALHRTEIAGEPVALSILAGTLYCHDTAGAERWSAHPEGLNFEAITQVSDLDGDGAPEILLQAGRPTSPYAAAVLLDLATGALRWRYDVEPMSYQWYLYAGDYLPDRASRQIFVVMMGYPPDPLNGYCALFDFDGGTPVQQWRYDFDAYTCFPTFHQTDLDGDGVKELVIQTHSRAWFLDAPTGAVKHFAAWDVAPANVRSYGYTRFVDLNNDGLEDFLCIANFAQHHEVLLNRGGTLEKAWHQGWAESVTTGKVVTTWPEPPYADVDGDGGLEIVVSMYNSEDEGAWLTRIYDAVDGTLLYRIPGLIATRCEDLNGDGTAEILGNRSADPTRSRLDGAVLYGMVEDDLTALWEEKTARAPENGPGVLLADGARRLLQIGEDGEVALATPPAEIPPPPGPEFSAIPALEGPPLPTLLAADITGDGRQELLLYRAPDLTVLAFADGQLTPIGHYTSTSAPTLADFDGDGRIDLALTHITPAAPPAVRVITPSLEDRALWETRFPETERAGLPQPRRAYTRAIHLTGKATPDLYVWAGTPLVRSAGLDGRTGALLWEKGEVGNERYWGPSVNLAAAFDYNGDGNEDLVFTNPDYYCVADGPTGELLHGPSFPPDIFDQPCQGLYTYPAILPRPGGAPDVLLAGGHYFQGGMTLAAEPHWYAIPAPGESRSGQEAFLQQADGSWLMGFGRQNGKFACVDPRTGTVLWEYDVAATCSDVISGDVDGDGRYEFIFGTSHGEIIALGDGGGQPRLVWRLKTGAAMGMPLLADFDGDGRVELACPQADGWVSVWGGS